jgi:transcriptional antiterminator RfaH
MVQWFVVSTKPKNEERASANLAYGGFEVFAPKLKLRKYREGRFVPVVEFMFPNYIFVRFDPVDDYHLIKYTRGVRSVIHFGDKITPLPDDFIAFIKDRTKDGVAEITKRSFEKGERIMVQEGPFKGLSGIFEKELDGKERVAILLEGISYSARMEIDRDLIAPP